MNDFTLLASLIVGYIGILLVTTIAVQPLRRRLVILVDDMLHDGTWSKDDREMLEFFAESCLSSTPGLMMPAAAAYSLADAILAGNRSRSKPTRLSRDARRKKLVALYLVSIAGASPIAALISAPLILLALVVQTLRGAASLGAVVEEPIRRMSHSLHHQHC